MARSTPRTSRGRQSSRSTQRSSADVAKDAGEYRQKDLFDARAFNSTRLEVTRNGQTAVFEKTKTKNKEGQDEEKWKQSAPTARDVDQTTVDNLISAVTAARAASFVDSAAKTGLDKPEPSRHRADLGRRQARGEA